nr:uncharacterized protein LOC125987414 isoform X2 [Syngnathus scovelli]
MVLKEFCSPLLETLFINCRPFYSPREFSSIVMAAVYIPPHARASEATQMLADQEAAQSQGGGLQERRPGPVQADQKHTELRVWIGLQSITGFKKRTPRPVESPRLADQLNRFYCRFDRSSHTTGPPAAQSTQSTYSPPPTTALSTPPSPWSPTLSLAEAAPALQIREEEVRQMFRRQKIRKAPGPDGVSPSCLKVCAEQLAPTFARIFNRSLELCEVPSCFKSSTIVPVAKKPAITGMNDYRPVALTSVVMKSFERLVLYHLKDVRGPLLDPLQFAYRANRSVDDAVNMGLHYILQHLDTPGKYARILFVDFSSAFNTIAPDILQQKLIQLAVPASTCQWITSFLTNRRQRVRLGSITSDTLTTNTGAPQGCVLSPLLFSLYTTYVRVKARGPHPAREKVFYGPWDDLDLLLEPAGRPQQAGSPQIFYTHQYFISHNATVTHRAVRCFISVFIISTAVVSITVKLTFRYPSKMAKRKVDTENRGVSNKVGVGVYVHGGSWKTCLSSVWRKCGGTERV